MSNYRSGLRVKIKNEMDIITVSYRIYSISTNYVGRYKLIDINLLLIPIYLIRIHYLFLFRFSDSGHFTVLFCPVLLVMPFYIHYGRYRKIK